MAATKPRRHITELMFAKGWSLSDLAKHANVSKQDLSRITRGESPAWPAWRRRIAKAFKVDENTILWEGPTTNAPACLVRRNGRAQKFTRRPRPLGTIGGRILYGYKGRSGINILTFNPHNGSLLSQARRRVTKETRTTTD